MRRESVGRIRKKMLQGLLGLTAILGMVSRDPMCGCKEGVSELN